MFDLRPLYAFDASEGQIPEGNVSVYGPANSHANCVPASFTAALDLAGFGDIDPQRLTNEIYGPNYRGGFGDFSRTIRWIKANVPNAPTFTDGPFDFDAADAAGQNGQLVIIAGWIDAPSVTFVARALAQGFSHASLLAGHLANDRWLIWNTWTGQMQTYSRVVLAASLYEMSVMGPTTGGADLSAEAEANILKILKYVDGSHLATPADPNHPSLDARVEEIFKEQRGEFQFDVHSLMTGAKVDPAFAASLPEILKAIRSVSGGGSATIDLAPVLNAIAASKLELDAIAADVASLKRRIEKDLAP